MRKSLLFLLTILFITSGHSQDFKGQWKGEFIDKSTSMINWGGDKCDYVLEIETSGRSVSGYSYTYFTDGGKKYYTICRLEGFIDRKNKYLEVRETERTKTNVPNNIRNCFQTHKLTYFKQGETEILEGSWVPAPKQDGDCGYGFTNLSRRVLKSNLPAFEKPLVSASPQKKTTTGSFRSDSPKNPPVVKQTPKKSDIPVFSKKPVFSEPETEKKSVVIPEKRMQPMPEYRKRNLNILRTIEVNTEEISVDLYDNGEIDGDSISLFYNGKLLVSKKMLTTKSLHFKLAVDKEAHVNELVMYAENLGSIPPNTALMIVNDGPKRYEVRITSDLQKSGVIQFVHESRGKEAAN